eukprot:m51a1_g12008 putative 3 5 -cyclic nucleotide phosphodiesterase (365) ;mRNA; r:585-2206
MGEFLPDADQPKGHTTVNLHLGWSRCSFWLELVSDLLSKGHGNSALPSLKLFYYIWLTDFPWLRCVKRKGEHRVCSICAAYWDQVCNHALTPEELMSLRTSQSQHHSDFTHERTFVVQECNACRSDAANRWCIIIDGMTAPNLPCLRCNYNNWGNCPRPGLLIMGVLDYTFNQVRYLLSMSGLWPKNQDLIGTTLLLHIIEHLRLNPTYQPRSLTLILNNPVNQNKNNIITSTVPVAFDSWDYDVNNICRVGEGSVLELVAMAALKSHNLIEAFGLDRLTLSSFLRSVEKGYKDNPYHNSAHAADVVQAVHALISDCKGMNFTPLEKLAALVAAVCHDYGHWGVNNTFLQATMGQLLLLRRSRK